MGDMGWKLVSFTNLWYTCLEASPPEAVRGERISSCPNLEPKIRSSGPICPNLRSIGKLGEYSDANTGLRPPCPNIHPKNVWPKVRTDFHGLTLCRRAGHSSEEKVQERFA